MIKYSTLPPDMEGLDYRTIANVMTSQGDMVGHSTVRNITLRIMERFACAIMAQYGAWGDPAMMARDANFQLCIAHLAQQAIFMKGRKASPPPT